MPDYTRTVTRVAIHRADESPVFGDATVMVEIDDEAAGPFIVLRSHNEIDTDQRGRVSIDPAQWPAVDAAARELMAQFDEAGERLKPEGGSAASEG